NDLRLLADAAEGSATAVIDLPRWTIDSRIALRLSEHPKAPPVGLVLEGPLDAPRKIFDTNGLQKFLAERGGERLPRSPSAPAEHGTGEEKGARPSEGLRDFLRGPPR